MGQELVDRGLKQTTPPTPPPTSTRTTIPALTDGGAERPSTMD